MNVELYVDENGEAHMTNIDKVAKDLIGTFIVCEEKEE